MGVACAQMLPSGMRSGLTTGKAGCAFSEEFLTYYFKVTPCNRKYPHDWASCLCGHKGERANRRDLRTYSYLPIACEYAKQKLECPLGDICPNSHNLFEYWLHPQRYKTEMCLFRANCDRPVCFFAHSAEELRALDPSLPPAEVCWSAGAALPGKEASSSSNSRESRQTASGSQAAVVAGGGGGNKQQHRQQYQQQKLHIQQLQQQSLFAQGQDAGLRQQQITVSSPAAQQQPMLVRMASGELALLAAVSQPLQQQQVVMDTHRHRLAGGIPSPVQTAGTALVSVQQLPAASMVNSAHHINPAASVSMSPAVLGPLLPASAAAAPGGAGGWPQQLLLDPLQLQLQQQQELQQQCYTNPTSLNPTLLQHQSIAGGGSSACAPHGLLYQQPESHPPGLAAGDRAAVQLFVGSVPGVVAASHMVACGSPGPLAAAAPAYQALQLRPEGLLGLAALGRTESGSMQTQLGCVMAAASGALPVPPLYVPGSGSITQRSVANQGPSALGLALPNDHMDELLTALQSMHINVAVTRA